MADNNNSIVEEPTKEFHVPGEKVFDAGNSAPGEQLKNEAAELQQEPEEENQMSPGGGQAARPEAKTEGLESGESAEDQAPQSKAEGEPEVKDESPTTGKGPKPLGPNQQTWENPKPGDELKKEIDEQLNRLKQLGENPSDHDPETDKLNKAQDIESRSEGPEHSKKSEKSTQEDFDPAKHKSDPPTH